MRESGGEGKGPKTIDGAAVQVPNMDELSCGVVVL